MTKVIFHVKNGPVCPICGAELPALNGWLSVFRIQIRLVDYVKKGIKFLFERSKGVLCRFRCLHLCQHALSRELPAAVAHHQPWRPRLLRLCAVWVNTVQVSLFQKIFENRNLIRDGGPKSLRLRPLRMSVSPPMRSSIPSRSHTRQAGLTFC